MTGMSSNDESTSKYFGESSQLTNLILDSGATCHMTPQIQNFFPSSLEEIDKYIEVAGGHYVMAKKN